MNTKYTVAYGDRHSESTLTFVSKHITLYDVLNTNGYKVTAWGLCKKPTYVEYDSNFYPTGRYFTLLNSENTTEEESNEVVFF